MITTLGSLRVLRLVQIFVCVLGLFTYCSARAATIAPNDPNPQYIPPDDGTTQFFTYVLTGDGTTKSMGGTFDPLPAGLSFTQAMGSSGSLQCTTTGIVWVSNGSPIPSTPQYCYYFLLFSSHTPGTRTISMHQSSCDGVCTFTPAVFNFGAEVAPTITYYPMPGATVTLAGTPTTASIVADPSGGTGSGTTTISGCSITGPGATAFGSAPAALSFVGSTTQTRTLPLTCTPTYYALTANLSCFETQGSAAAVTRTWPLVCSPTGSPSGPPSVTLSVSETRISQNRTLTLNWNPINTTGCSLSGGQPGTTFVSTGANSATVNVVVGTPARDDVFTVTCTSSTVSVKATVTVAVGIPAAPPPVPVTRVSSGLGGAAPDGASRKSSISDAGRYIAFQSTATNLVLGDSNGQSDVFLREKATGKISRISKGTGGAQLSGPSGEPSISRDGTVVALVEGAGTTLSPPGQPPAIAGGQVCINFPALGIQKCVSKSPGGQDGNGSSNNPSLSGDGTEVLFESTSTNLTTTPDSNGAVADVFAYDTKSAQTQLLSASESGQPATGKSIHPKVSCNARNYTFASEARLTADAVQAGVRNVYAGPLALPLQPKRLVSVGIGGEVANGASDNPAITDDGRFVVFESAASNLVPDDTNGVKDIFIADALDHSITRISTNLNGTQGNGNSQRPTISCDGASVTFESEASNLVPGDSNQASDTFVFNRGTHTIALLSQVNGQPTNGSSSNAQISPDGTTIGFDSSAPNLGAGSQGDVFSGGNPFSTQNYTGAWYDLNQSGHGLFLDQLPDGQMAAWWFTFDPAGAQAWFGGVGPAQGATATIDIFRTGGTRFIPNFRASEIVNVPLGTLTFDFTSCTTGRVNFRLDPTFGSGSMNLTRLTTPLGVGCGTPPPETTSGPIAAVTGAWYDPAQSGHGLFLQNLGNRQLLAWWFTFDANGGQAWFGGVGTITDSSHATIEFVRTQGGRWIPNFNPAQVTNPTLGTVTITMDSCDSGRLNYAFQPPFGTGTMILRPLFRSAGTSCAE